MHKNYLSEIKIMLSLQDDYDEERETNLSAVLASRQLWDGANMVRMDGFVHVPKLSFES